MQNETACLNDLSAISQGFFQFHGDSSSPEHNPFAKKFTQTCSVMKGQILPLLSGTLAVVVKRFWVFIMALPLFLLSLILGLVDGLVQRDIRKFKGARESTLLFHKIKRSGAALFFCRYSLISPGYRRYHPPGFSCRWPWLWDYGSRSVCGFSRNMYRCNSMKKMIKKNY